MANEIFTRIQLKYDSYTEWQKVEATFKPLKGEICIVNPATNLADAAKVPCLMKVGDGTNFFKDLPWVSATAADVYKWAKAADVVYDAGTQSIEFRDASDNSIKSIALTNLVSNEKLAEVLAEYYTTTVAEGTGINVTDAGTDGNHAYTVALDVDGAKTALGLGSAAYTDADAYATAEQGGKADTAVQPEALNDYYTKTEADAEFATPAEVESIIDTALAEVSGTDAIEGITTLVTYVNEHGTDLAAITKEIYGDSGKVGDDPSRIDTAIADSAQAKADAAAAVSTANGANATAGEAKTLAQEAKQAATDATTGAAASAEAAAASALEASNAAAGASAAQGKAEDAQEAAETARDAAVNAKTAAETAQNKAEHAQDYAEDAQGKAEAAKSAAATSEANAKTSETNAGNSATAAAGSASAAAKSAEDADASADAAAQSATDANAAKEAAEAAKEAAEASNTSATAIANQAKTTADGAKEAADAATEAVAGLHAIATSGSIYDVAEGSNTTATGAVKYLVFNCGTASTLID